MNAFDYHSERDAAAGVALRVEEYLRVYDILGLTLLQVGPGQIVKILLRLQHRCRLIVEVQKRLQILEVIKSGQLLGRRIGKIDPVSLGQPEHHFRFQCAFDMQL